MCVCVCVCVCVCGMSELLTACTHVRVCINIDLQCVSE